MITLKSLTTSNHYLLCVGLCRNLPNQLLAIWYCRRSSVAKVARLWRVTSAQTASKCVIDDDRIVSSSRGCCVDFLSMLIRSWLIDWFLFFWKMAPLLANDHYDFNFQEMTILEPYRKVSLFGLLSCAFVCICVIQFFFLLVGSTRWVDHHAGIRLLYNTSSILFVTIVCPFPVHIL